MKPKRLENRKLLKEVASRRCIISGCPEKSVACHIGTKGARQDDVENNLFPACITHHGEQHTIGIISFARKYPEVGEEFTKKGWNISDYKLRRAE